LAQADNIALLSDETGIDITVIATEHNVGRFSVDIFAEEEQSGKKIIIENQLERTDHDHLGKLITYASGLEAEIVIWIVREALEEHQQAIDWLNENTREKLKFFLIRMELWRIGDSAAAPKFHILGQPNDWGKAVRASVDLAELTDTKKLQLQFWDGFREFLDQSTSRLNGRKPRAQHWYSLAIGRSDCHISLTINSRTNEMACELYINEGEDLYEEFLAKRESIEAQLGELVWMELPDKKASRIKQTRTGSLENEQNWIELFAWCAERAEAFRSVFGR
jgi:hypothetical protein